MNHPEFSLIIPTYNRFALLEHCFERLAKLRYHKNDFEVIVVDDGSSDATKDLSDRTEPFTLRVIHKPNGGTSSARNAGIQAARGLYCMFVDDDVMVQPDLLRVHHEAHLAQPNRLVRGSVINMEQLPEASSSAEQAQLEEIFCGPLPPRKMLRHYSRNYLCTSNASLLREHLLAAGLFDTTFPRWEDAELAVRLKRIGVQRYFTLRAVVYHLKPPESMEARLRTAGKDGASAALLYLRYPSFLMRLRSGLHLANTLRNAVFTSGPLAKLTEQSAQGRGPFPKAMAENLLIEKAYLNAGYSVLRQDKP